MIHGGSGEPGVPNLLELTDVALELALRAGEITLRYFGEIVPAEQKADGSPVTRADREAEELIRSGIRSRYPDHSILGEELDEHVGSAPVRWILDPIDGTRAFMRGVPLYAVLIGIEVGEEPLVGVAHFPALHETVAGARGRGCRWWPSEGESPVAASVSKVSDLAHSLATTTDPERILASPIGSGWRSLSRRVDMVRGWGDAYGHVLVATGRADIMIDPILSAWDAAPLLPIVTEAGGRFTDLGGRETIRGGSGISTNGLLHQWVLDIMVKDGDSAVP